MQRLIENLFNRCALAAPDRILVATDLSDLTYLTPHAIAQAITSPAQITLVHAVVPQDSLPVEAPALPYLDASKVNRDARLSLLDVAREIEAHGISCKVVVKNGYAVDVIREETDRTGATRLILGTHGRGTLGQLVLGSVAREMITSMPVPVFVVGPHARDTVRHITPRRILHPVSLTGDSHHSVDLAIEIAQAYRAELTLLHVLDRDVADTINPDRALNWARKALDTFIPDATDLVPPVHTMVSTGKLADEILKAADQVDADWIVLGTDAAPRFDPIGASLACQLLARVKCPVLTLCHDPSRLEAKKLREVHFTFPS